jgi:hypothetical protein
MQKETEKLQNSFETDSSILWLSRDKLQKEEKGNQVKKNNN